MSKVAAEESQLPWTSAREEGYYELQRKSSEHCSIIELQEIKGKHYN